MSRSKFAELWLNTFIDNEDGMEQSAEDDKAPEPTQPQTNSEPSHETQASGPGYGISPLGYSDLAHNVLMAAVKKFPKSTNFRCTAIAFER